MATKRRIGDLLIAAGAIIQDQLEMALQTQTAEIRRRQLGEILISLGFLTESEIADALAQQMGLARMDLDEVSPDPALRAIVPQRMAEEQRLIPISLKGNTLLVGMVDPTDIHTVDYLRTTSGYRIERAVVTPTELSAHIGTFYHGLSERLDVPPVRVGPHTAAPDPGRQRRDIRDDMDHVASLVAASEAAGGAGEMSTIRLVNAAIERALELLASDVHFVTGSTGMRVRIRVDGRLLDAEKIPFGVQTSVIARIKLLANLDVTERRSPQEGHARLNVNGQEVDLRVTVTPSLHGETAVLRLLDQLSGPTSIDQLGFSPEQLQRVRKTISRPQGLILVTGPTGSGKTTSMYCMLRNIMRPELHILTLEDPIEHELEGATQIQVDERSGFDFAEGLHSALRLDADILMVGEIRDAITAKTAFEASLTGHLVLSTLHTNGAVGAVSRLIQMGIEPYLISSALTMVVAQRLVRKNCPRCRKEVNHSADELTALGLPAALATETYFAGAGCNHCDNTGYRHRAGLFQLLEVDRGLKDLILARAPESELNAYAKHRNMTSLREEGLAKALAGDTTLSEVAAVTEPI